MLEKIFQHGPMQARFHDRFREKRETLGVSKYRLAQLTGVSESLVGKIESGKTIPEQETITKLAPVLGVPVDEMQAWADADRLGEEGMARLAQYIPDLQRALAHLKDITGETQALEVLGRLDPVLRRFVEKLLDTPIELRRQQLAAFEALVSVPDEQIAEAVEAAKRARDQKLRDQEQGK